MNNITAKCSPKDYGVMTNVHKLSLEEARQIVEKYLKGGCEAKKRLEAYCKLHTYHTISELITKVAYNDLDDKCKTFVSKMLDVVDLKNPKDRFLAYKLSYELKLDKQTGNTNAKHLKYQVYHTNKTFVCVKDLTQKQFEKLANYLKQIDFYLLDRNSMKFEKEEN